jgi:hypothetical protein
MTYISLIEKLDAFVRKYYRNKALKGVLLATAIVTGGFLLLAVTEYFGRFGVMGRTVLFWSFTVVAAGVIAKMIIIPLLHIARLGKIISHEDASKIVGDHFPEVKDKLLNTLQLQGQIANHDEKSDLNVDLLIASVEQRTLELSPIPFTSAIDIKENARYLKYAIGPIVVLFSVLIWRPSVVSEPAERLIQHRTSFEAPSPFRFVVVSVPLKAPVGEGFDFVVRVEGSVVPSTVYLEEGENRYRM